MVPHTTGDDGGHIPVLQPSSSNPIIPTHPEGVVDVVPQLVTWLISGNVTRTKDISEEGTEPLLVYIMATEVVKSIQLTRLKVGGVVQ